MYLDHRETIAWVDAVAGWLGSGERRVDLFFFPQFPSLADVAQRVKETPLGFGGQNMAPVERGAFTGEVSVHTLVQLGCNYVELGHSERRTLYNENDEDVRKKARLALEHGLIPVVCIGEAAEQIEEAASVVKSQVRTILAGQPADRVSRIILAYEPRWAIGQDAPAPLDHIRATHNEIRSAVAETAGSEVAEAMRIIYGGSVDLKSGADILALPDVDGLFIGRAALNPQNFIEFIRIGESAR